MSAYAPEFKERVIDDCRKLLTSGVTVEQIALRHSIPRATVYSWILGDETVEQARGEMIAQELARCVELLRTPEGDKLDSPMDIARAREQFRAWSWLAERRQARLYGQQKTVTIEIGDLGDRLRRAKERTIEHSPLELIHDRTKP